MVNERFGVLGTRDDKSNSNLPFELDVNESESILDLPGMSSEVRQNWQNQIRDMEQGYFANSTSSNGSHHRGSPVLD